LPGREALGVAVLLMVACGGRTGLRDVVHSTTTSGGTGGGGALDASRLETLPDSAACNLAWSQLFPTGVPPTPRAYSAVVYDEANQRMIVFGGTAISVGDGGTRHPHETLGDVWALSLPVDGTPAWTQLFPLGPTPEAREGASAIYDAAEQRMIVFGGKDEGPPLVLGLNDVWVLSLPAGGVPAWTQLAVSGPTPAVRYVHAAAFDPASRRMVVQGGLGLDDTWVLSLPVAGNASWTSVADISPGLRAFNTAVFAGAGRILVFGCAVDIVDGAIDSNVWLLAQPDALGWTLVDTTGAPPAPRGYTSAVYDGAGRVLFCGGRDAEESFRNDTWAFDWQPSGGAAWTRLAPDGTPPAPRLGHHAIYDSAGQRMVIYGGFNGSLLGDVWVLGCRG
jgi:hypothetical protein